MFPIIASMEEWLIYMGGGVDRLSAHFGDEAGGPGFPAEPFAGDADRDRMAGTRDRHV